MVPVGMVRGRATVKLKCLNKKCNYKDLHSYDCLCPKCGIDLYYKYHYGIDLFTGRREKCPK